jgi:hypothetical protein
MDMNYVASREPDEAGITAVRPVSVVAPTPRALPGPAAAVPVAEAALHEVMATHDQAEHDDPVAAAADLLRSVEALLRTTTPAGLSTEDLADAAAHLVDQQGLLARLTSDHAPGTAGGDSSWEQAAEEESPTSVDTRL